MKVLYNTILARLLLVSCNCPAPTGASAYGPDWLFLGKGPYHNAVFEEFFLKKCVFCPKNATACIYNELLSRKNEMGKDTGNTLALSAKNGLQIPVGHFLCNFVAPLSHRMHQEVV